MGQMSSNILVIAQPRSGGTLACAVMSKVYNISYEGEVFNTHRYGFDINRQIKNFKTPSIVKASYYDLKEDFDNVLQIGFNKIYHVYRTNPVEMVCSSFLSSITDVFHVHKPSIHLPVENQILGKEFVDWFFNKENPGGWYYNNPKNIPFLKNTSYIPLFYDDTTTESNMLQQITGLSNNIELEVQKLYRDKSTAIKNLEEVKEWVNNYVKK